MNNSADAALTYSSSELTKLGYSLTELNTQQTLMCSADGTQCICLEELICENDQACPSLEENLRIFNQALDSSDTPVDCRHASVGTCGAFTYFQFNGDIHKREMRWFDKNGKLLGVRNATDYAAYCGNKTRIVYRGKIPKCEKSVQEKHICGEQWSHGLSPLKTLGL